MRGDLKTTPADGTPFNPGLHVLNALSMLSV